MKRMALSAILLLFAGIGPGQAIEKPARRGQIVWVKDLGTAQRLARAQKKLVLEFLMLGDLTDPNC
jgi:hypothetical protein